MLWNLQVRQAKAYTVGIAAAAWLAVSSVCCTPIGAQQQGPLPTPPSSSASQNQPDAPATTQTPGTTTSQGATSSISNQPPALPVDQIIQRFAAREAEFKKERDNYTYTQTFVIQTIDGDGMADGEYQMRSDILFTPDGKRYEKVTYAPASTLLRIQMSQQDLDDLEHVQPFVLTTDELPKYDIKYVGREAVDQLNTYVFDVGPKKLEKNQRYFQGRIWVDDADLEIVKTDGKAVPDIKKHGQENVFPRFETFRENIEGHYWFPTYTRADDMLQFSTGAVHIRMTVRYANYKRFGVTIKIGAPVQVQPKNP
ncbi:MAG TPA: hypothetical protein VK818_23690 [Methylomirabilota bacterium]|jgi:hypothetical protein|nr:hypothetical protein [Methylomirabilota bacterium]